jgi:L-Lysine epsilon oxidase N-terminal
MEKVALDQAVVNEAIVKAAIYPSIGIARVGNSLTGWYVGPEVPDPLPLPPGSYRDDAGALKREASRFRIYGLNAAGTIVRELTSADADITWTVQLANKKAAWYGFQLALDIPEASAPGSDADHLAQPIDR